MTSTQQQPAAVEPKTVNATAFGRFTVREFFTRFSTTTWFVEDREQLDEVGLATVLVQTDSKSEAFARLVGLTYNAAKAADDAFHRALVAEYGAKNAGDARYKTRHASASVQALGNAYVVAADAYRAASGAHVAVVLAAASAVRQ